MRVPGAWRAGRPPRPQVSATVGGKAPAGLGTDALLDFSMAVTLDGERLTDAEVAALLAASDGLHLIRGRWVEIDRERLRRVLDQFQRVEQTAAEQGLTFAEAMRMLAGADVSGDGAARDGDRDWSHVMAGAWLAETLAGLRGPQGLARVESATELRAALRPYQQVGVRWLHLLSRLGLGACLADDMGLGKTIQVLSLLLALRTAAGRREANQPARRAGVAPGELDGGDRALHAKPEGAGRASVGHDCRRAAGASARSASRTSIW